MSSVKKKPVVKVFGLGGRGVSALNYLIDKGLQGPVLVAANTDLQDLRSSKAPIKIQVGAKALKGLGAGGNPENGKKGLSEILPEIVGLLVGADLAVLISGLAGGTGSALPMVTRSLAARKEKPLMLAVTFSPFDWEDFRAPVAQKALRDLRNCGAVVLDIANARICESYPELSLLAAKKKADEAIYRVMSALTYFSDKDDFLKVLAKKGLAAIGYGEASGAERAKQALDSALAHPLMSGFSLKDARGVLVNVVSSHRAKESEIKTINRQIQDGVGQNVEIVSSVVVDDKVADPESLRVTVIMTGLVEGRRKS
ncbi:MAG: hypothetical protein LBT86_00380 [Deltaproteobacteria bacterium]|jgi:cell division protein FtsZ|nr:hypothetical protein [Deltaproteobacteria bacterium]